MSNSWCKVVDNKMIDGPRAWVNNTPPDDTWIPHELEETAHTDNDTFAGSHFEIRGNKVVEVKDYRAKTQEEIKAELESIKNHAANEQLYADEMINLWQTYKTALEPCRTLTTLDKNVVFPERP